MNLRIDDRSPPGGLVRRRSEACARQRHTCAKGALEEAASGQHGLILPANCFDRTFPYLPSLIRIGTGYSGLICTMRHLMGPPGAPLSRLLNCKEIGPSGNWPCSISTVLIPLSTTVSRGPLAVIS